MKRLYVLYDATCGVCLHCRNWLMRQPAFVALEFIPLQSPELSQRFPGIEAFHPGEQLLVVDDNGGVYRGAVAWVMCLWALREYREYGRRLAEPMLLPFARVACELFSQNRFLISRLVFRQDSRTLARDLAAHAEPHCVTTNCSVA